MQPLTSIWNTTNTTSVSFTLISYWKVRPSRRSTVTCFFFFNNRGSICPINMSERNICVRQWHRAPVDHNGWQMSVPVSARYERLIQSIKTLDNTKMYTYFDAFVQPQGQTYWIKQWYPVRIMVGNLVIMIENFSCFPHSIQINSEIVPPVRPWPLPFTNLQCTSIHLPLQHSVLYTLWQRECLSISHE